MGPRLVRRGSSGGAGRHLAQDSASMGPRLVRRGSRCGPSHRAAASFNGAAPGSARKFRAADKSRLRQARFNGAAPGSARKSQPEIARMQFNPGASMGPRLVRRGSAGLAPAPLNVHSLQWGRAWFGAEVVASETRETTAGFNGAAPGSARKC